MLARYRVSMLDAESLGCVAMVVSAMSHKYISKSPIQLRWLCISRAWRLHRHTPCRLSLTPCQIMARNKLTARYVLAVPDNMKREPCLIPAILQSRSVQ